MDDIRQALAKGYCTKENENKELDADLIEAMTREIIKLCMICHLEERKEEGVPKG